MLAKIGEYTINLAQPVCLGQALRAVLPSPPGDATTGPDSIPPQSNAYFAPLFAADPVRAGSFVGSTALGGPLNFFNLRLNPHGNGTHTECVGHIARERFVLSECLTRFFFLADLVSVVPERMAAPAGFTGMDEVVTRAGLETGLKAALTAAATAGLAAAAAAATDAGIEAGLAVAKSAGLAAAAAAATDAGIEAGLAVAKAAGLAAAAPAAATEGPARWATPKTAGQTRLAGPDSEPSANPTAENPSFPRAEALVLRTAGEVLRRNRNWSGTNPPYLQAEALAWLADAGYEHLLVDLPSVDREEDGGGLAAHRAWWRYPWATRTQATITEMIVVPDHLPDGRYLLQMQLPLMDMDAAPSNPVLYFLN